MKSYCFISRWNWVKQASLPVCTKYIYVISFLFLISPLSFAFDDQESAMKAFAELLKIPLDYPEVETTIHSVDIEDGLVVEDLSWKSLDEENVPAFVIRPAEFKGQLPAIICLHGTGGSRDAMTTEEFGRGEWTRSGSNSSHERFRGWARELSRRGYLTLAMTQRGLDKRTPRTNARTKNLLVRGRTMMGAIVYEIRQAITYLQKREDVYPDKIGITGMSFGGITSFYTWLVDDRIDAAAPLCGGVGSVDVFLEIGSRGYHGFYWWIPNMLTVGDQGDFAAAMAPRPLMLWAPLDDIGMPKEGVDRFLEEVKPAYKEAGALDNPVIHRPPGKHSFTMEAFNAMLEFFNNKIKTQP